MHYAMYSVQILYIYIYCFGMCVTALKCVSACSVARAPAVKK